MVLIGPTGSGKDSLAKYLTAHCRDIMRREGGLSITVPGGESELREKVYSSGATAAAAPDRPHLAESWTLTPTNGAKPAALIVFNTAGEDLRPVAPGEDLTKRRSDLRHAFRVVPYADILVFFVPPSALIPELDPLGVGFQRTRGGFSAIADLLREFSISQPQVNQKRTVVLALSKCDKYANRDDFPKELLSDRPGNRWAIIDLIREQAQLAKFIMGQAGGESLMDTIAPLSDRLFLAAVSGTGTDKAGGDEGSTSPGDVVEGAHEAPPPNSAPIRAFDPLIIGLMRAGIWQGPES